MRYCSKTACAREAVASYAFNYADRVVWLASLTREPHPAFYDLCEVHTLSLRVPRGWSVDDLRSEAAPDPLPDVPAASPRDEGRRPEEPAGAELGERPDEVGEPSEGASSEPPVAALPTQASFLA